MISTLLKYRKALPDSDDKTNLKKLINMFSFGSKLEPILKFIDKRITETRLTTETSSRSEFSNRLWNKIRTLVSDTYAKNRELTNDKS